jgi:hypothetical protein
MADPKMRSQEKELSMTPNIASRKDGLRLEMAMPPEVPWRFWLMCPPTTAWKREALVVMKMEIQKVVARKLGWP